jgi:hypothetical protein
MNPFEKEDNYKHSSNTNEYSNEAENQQNQLHPEEAEEGGLFRREDEINLNNDLHCDNFGNTFEHISDNFQNSPQKVDDEPFETDKNIFEARVTKMNERYFSNNEEDEIKDCDLIIEDEESNEESSSRTNQIQDRNENSAQKETFFYDNNYWKSKVISDEDIMKELDII